jgi:hypothetical protein
VLAARGYSERRQVTWVASMARIVRPAGPTMNRWASARVVWLEMSWADGVPEGGSVG